MSRRLGVFAILILVLFAAVATQSANIQYFRAPALDASVQNPRNLQTGNEYPRGEIVAADGTVLAKSVPATSGYYPFTRVYPLGSLTSGLVGFASPSYGTWALEAEYNQYLIAHAQPPQSFVQVLSPTSAADTVTLTLQPSLERVAARALAGHQGAAVVLDPNTGAVLAMSSYPSYNLNSFVNGLSQSTFNSLMKVGAFNNYAIQGLYTPGSTFKLVTATAQMQTGIFSPNTLVNDTGIYVVPGCLQGGHGCVFHDAETFGNGLVNLPLALTVSSDYYFYNLGYLFWLHQRKYGQTAIQNVAHQYGLDQYTNIDLPNEVPGRVDSPAVRKELHALAPKAFPNVAWYTGDNIEMAFGQGATALTPIALADAYATFANGGTRYAPEVAAGILSPSGKVIRRYAPRVLGHVHLTPAIRAPILQGLYGVINNPRGTGYYPFHQNATFSLSAFPLAGKTGTASNAPGMEPNSLFVGFGPVNRPKYVVVCVIGEGGYGANAAAPVVAKAFNYLVAHPIRPVSMTPKLTLPASTTTTTTIHAGTTTTTLKPTTGAQG